MTEQFAVGPAPAATGWRPKLALLLFVLAVVSPLLVPLVAAMDLPTGSSRALAGLLLFGLPMALMLAVVALAGRPAYAFIKRLVEDTAPAEVGVARYRSGGVLVLHHALWKGQVADDANEDDETLIIRESLQAVQGMDEFTATLLPVGDGLLVAVKG